MAVFGTEPLSISAWVIVYVPVKVVVSVSLTSRVVGPPLTVTSGSETITLVRVTFPSLLTSKE